MFADSPEFLVTPEDVSGDLGQEVVLQCVADSNPSPAYKWFRNDNKDMVSSLSDTLGFKNVPSKTVKVYSIVFGNSPFITNLVRSGQQ